MPLLDDCVMEGQQHISADSSVLVGKPVIKGTRISVELVLGCLARGWTIDEFLGQYPHVTREGVIACIDYARAANTSSTHAFSGPISAGVHGRV